MYNTSTKSKCRTIKTLINLTSVEVLLPTCLLLPHNC